MSSELSSPDLLTPYEIIFSCAICQATITELYRQPRTDHGFSSGDDDRERVVTQLWLAECGHLTCSGHLEGGGVPFYPEGEKPRAPCPLCVSEKSDTVPRALFGISGCLPGEHDKEIPNEYFEVPPHGLNSRSIISSALRFQYMSLVRFAGAMSRKYHETKREANTTHAQAQDLAASLQESKKGSVLLQAKVNKLEAIERKHQKYLEREPEIRHYLEHYAALAKENDMLKTQFKHLGYDVPRTTWGYDVRNDTAVDGDISTIPAAQKLKVNGTLSSGCKRTCEEYLDDADERTICNRLLDSEHLQPSHSERQAKQRSGADLHKGWQQSQRMSRCPSSRGSRLPYADGSFVMSGALRPRQSHTAAQNTYHKPTARLIQARSRAASPENEYMPAKSSRHKQDLRLCNDEITMLYDRQPLQQDLLVETQQPPHEILHQSMIRQPPRLAPSLNNMRQRDSDHQPFSDHYNAERDGPDREPVPPKSHTPRTPIAVNATRSSFFPDQTQIQQHGIETSMARNLFPQRHPQQLFSDLNRPRMEQLNSTPPVPQSLNSLSFIQEPYTQANKLVYAAPASQRLSSRTGQPQNTGYTQHLNQHRTYFSDLSIPTGLNSKAPPFFKPTHYPSSRRADIRIDEFKGVKGTCFQSPSGTHYLGMNTQARFPYQQRSMYTANGRRSIRR